MEKSPSLPPDTVTPDPGWAQECWHCSQQHLTCFSAHKKLMWNSFHFFFHLTLGTSNSPSWIQRPLTVSHRPWRERLAVSLFFLYQLMNLVCSVFQDINPTCDNGTGLTAVSYLEKASFSTSSPGSTQRCRAVEKCPQATAISATSYNMDQTWQTDLILVG